MRTSGSRTVLDSTVAIAILNDDDGFGSWAEAFQEIFLPVPAIGELRFGALHSGRTVENLRKVSALLSRCRILEVRLETTDAYAWFYMLLVQSLAYLAAVVMSFLSVAPSHAAETITTPATPPTLLPQ